MKTVRFPNGQAVVYSNANYVEPNSEYTDLYEEKDGRWIAQIPNTCIIEAVSACLVYDALQAQPRALRRKMKK